jgi:hypothetical protein
VEIVINGVVAEEVHVMYLTLLAQVVLEAEAEVVLMEDLRELAEAMLIILVLLVLEVQVSVIMAEQLEQILAEAAAVPAAMLVAVMVVRV